MAVVFQKMHGAGNDFVLFDLRNQSFELNRRTVTALSNRRTGIGCDQVLVLKRPADPVCVADFDVWNADGSRAEQCGNGVRCIGLYLDSRDETPAGPFVLGGPVAQIKLECLADGQVRVDMGEPVFEAQAVPVSAEKDGDWYRIDAVNNILHIGAVSMGNPHALLRVDDIERAPVADLGPFISRNPLFPKGCNAGFAEVLDRKNIRLRVYERGAGETLACGSGACAAVAILRNAGLVEQQVLVNQVGGALIIEWPGKNHPLKMTGPASHIFEGILK